MATTPDVYTTHRFWVELKGITEAEFSECSGLQAEIEVEERREGGRNGYVHRLLGRVKAFPNLVLKRGVATGELWNWYYSTAQGTLKRQNLSIVLVGYAGNATIRWDIIGALPVKWAGPTFKAGTGEVAFETLELIHNGFTLAS